MRPGLLCGNNLDRAWGIFDNWGVVMYTQLLWRVRFNSCTCVITGRCWRIGVQEWIIACGGYWYRCCTWYWGRCVALISHFLRKWWFLNVALPDPSTLVWYWWSGGTVMIFPVVFYGQMSGLRIASVSPACNGQGWWVYIVIPFYYFIWAAWGCRIHQLLLCRGVRPPQRVSCIWH